MVNGFIFEKMSDSSYISSVYSVVTICIPSPMVYSHLPNICISIMRRTCYFC